MAHAFFPVLSIFFKLEIGETDNIVSLRKKYLSWILKFGKHVSSLTLSETHLHL